MREHIKNQIQDFSASELVRIKEKISHKLPLVYQDKQFRISAIEQTKNGWVADILLEDKTKIQIKSTDADIY